MAWGEEDDKRAIQLFEEHVAGAVYGLYPRMAAEWPGDLDTAARRVLADKLKQLLREGGRLWKQIHAARPGALAPWRSQEIRRLRSLVESSQGEHKWVEWAGLFPLRTPADVRSQARKVFPVLYVSSHRCAYGLNSSVRCDNTRMNASVTFQQIPNIPMVLSHMGLQNTWCKWMLCCSGHGQDQHKPLSRTNLPSRAAPQLLSPAMKKGLKREFVTPPAPERLHTKRRLECREETEAAAARNAVAVAQAKERARETQAEQARQDELTLQVDALVTRHGAKAVLKRTLVELDVAVRKLKEIEAQQDQDKVCVVL
jgi:hypothetical protein